MKQFYKIEDFIDTTSSAFALKGTSPLSADATEVTMCSSANVLAEINDSFAERSIYVKETETPFNDFSAMWARWLSRRGDRLAASWEALHTKYKPLENYDRYEAGEDTKTLTPAETTTTIAPAETTNTITPAGTTRTETPAEVTNTITPAETTVTDTPAEVTNTTTPAETTTTDAIVSPGLITTTENQVYGYNSSAAVDQNKNTATQTGSRTNALEVNTAGSDALTVQTAGSNKFEVDSAGSEALTVQQAGTDVLTVDTAGSDVLTVQTAGSQKIEVDTAGEEKIEYGKHTYGNIGVTSAMDLIKQEMEIDEKDFVYEAICEFISLYTVYA